MIFGWDWYRYMQVMYTQTAVPAAVMSRVVSTHVAMHVAMHVAVSNGKYQSDKTVTERRIR